MAKILYNIPNDRQILLDLTGKNIDTTGLEVLWDERIHGLMPEITLGKMEAYDEIENSIIIRKLRVLNDFIPSHLSSLLAEHQKNINKEARAYLASTDWYVIRKEETGVAIPQEILDARAAARASIVE